MTTKTPRWCVGVVIPARDEAALVGDAVSSVRAACAHLPADVGSWIVVVADSCTDATASVAEEALGGAGTVVVVRARSVGASRAVGVEHVLARWSHPAHRIWLANTDADSVVPATWLSDQLALAERGAAAVAGIVAVDSFAEHADGVGAEFQRNYAADVGQAHPHVHGANLGVRADAYCDIGRWRALATAEDHDLWRRLTTRGWPVRSVSSVVVTTSGRRVGRAPGGFAAGLCQLGRRLVLASRPVA